jgi:hypothetical protein
MQMVLAEQVFQVKAITAGLLLPRGLIKTAAQAAEELVQKAVIILELLRKQLLVLAARALHQTFQGLVPRMQAGVAEPYMPRQPQMQGVPVVAVVEQTAILEV